ncbi:hypothetical protein ACLB2K_030670 [Fragaria x ananassa]
MSSEEDQFHYCSAIQFSGDKRLWIRSRTAPIRFRLLKLIHSCRRWVDPSGVDMVPITLKLYHQTVTFPGDEFRGGPSDISYGESNWTLRVPEDKHPDFIQKISRVILRAVPGLPFSVRIVRVTRQVAPKAFTSYIKGLEKVRVDSLEEASTKNTPCAICTEDLDRFRGGIDNDDEQTIIRLPCLHLYHVDCIFPWLKRSLVCPLCRSSMPLAKPAKSSARRRWPMLFSMSSGGVITAMRILTSLALPPVLFLYFMKIQLSHSS